MSGIGDGFGSATDFKVDETLKDLDDILEDKLDWEASRKPLVRANQFTVFMVDKTDKKLDVIHGDIKKANGGSVLFRAGKYHLKTRNAWDFIQIIFAAAILYMLIIAWKDWRVQGRTLASEMKAVKAEIAKE